MIDYSKGQDFYIENVEHEYEIFGVKLHFFVYMGGSYLFLMFVNPAIAILSFVPWIFIARKFYHAEMKGVPIEYGEFWNNQIVKIPFAKYLFSFYLITPRKDGYYGN